MDSEEEMLINIALLADDLDLTLIDGLEESLTAVIEVLQQRQVIDLDLVTLSQRLLRKLQAYRARQF